MNECVNEWKANERVNEVVNEWKIFTNKRVHWWLSECIYAKVEDESMNE